ncbi:type II secretion system secretin GspD [Endozoicomonas sp. SM1973]|uniref:Type II secretion system secretin GspD n=1 Tax=Spartinivicinus marinus TaxID=2994442 RepID=A0A853IC53_9GAMM|nr:type II secretion system secretin GspD [Spartinivicinus marinus]MCX4024962.1 type II secretion system secretin GspD [Spartinivicinus marinus]NYZ67654.1 type II secretion system secretin GspD [Spartinivicinus marinus]
MQNALQQAAIHQDNKQDSWNNNHMSYQQQRFTMARLTKLFHASVLCLCFSVTPVTLAETNADDGKRWTINQKNADIREFIAQVASITGETIIVDPRIKGPNNVTVVSASPLSKEEIYDVFLSVLHANGFTAVPNGKTINIVPTNKAKSDVPIFNGKSGPRSGHMITKVVPLVNLSAVELIPVIRPLIPQYGHAAAIASSNSIIISDHSANVKRLAKLIREMDLAENADHDVIKLEHAWVGDVVKVIKEGLLGGQQQRKPAGQIIADERTNRLIITGKPAFRNKVKRMARSMDVEADSASSTRVIHLRHADAKNLAEALSELSKSLTVQSGKDKKDAKQSIIKADESQNALIIAAEPEMIRELENIVRQLDVRRAQVLIESAIVEVSGDISEQLGIQWGITGKDTKTGGDKNGSGISSIIGATIKNTEIPIGQLALRNSNFGILLNAITQQSNSNLLSTPSLMTMDNEEAEILVGQEVPFQTGQYTTGSDGANNPFTTVERKDVGLKLKVTPHINEGDTMRLEIDQEISNVITSAESSNNLNQVTSKRQIKSTILVDDSKIIVLGGLLQDDVVQGESSVPILSRIPLVGRLFENDNNSHKKRNLMVFIKPTIIRNANEVNGLTRDKYSSIKLIKSAVDKRTEKYDIERARPDDANKLFTATTHTNAQKALRAQAPTNTSDSYGSRNSQPNSYSKPVTPQPVQTSYTRPTNNVARTSTATPVSSARWAVQLASYKSATAADQAISNIQKRHGSLLNGLQPKVKSANYGKRGTYYRVLFTGIEKQSTAMDICRKLKAVKQGCLDTRQ